LIAIESKPLKRLISRIPVTQRTNLRCCMKLPTQTINFTLNEVVPRISFWGALRKRIFDFDWKGDSSLFTWGRQAVRSDNFLELSLYIFN